MILERIRFRVCLPALGLTCLGCTGLDLGSDPALFPLLPTPIAAMPSPVSVHPELEADSSEIQLTRYMPPVEALPESVPVPPSPQMVTADPGQLIDLTTALELVAGRNPEVAIASERVREAIAQHDAAKTLWLPSIRAGMSYNKHDGTLQASDGQVIDVNRASLQSGLGVLAVGAGTQAVPGVFAQFHAADAVFAPRIASLTTGARQEGARAERNDALLGAALVYIDLLEALQARAITDETLGNVQQLAELTARFAEVGQGPQSDADRTQAERTFRLNDQLRADETIAITQARLNQVLSLDPALRLWPAEAHLIPVELVPVEVPEAELVGIALTTRPELAESRLLAAQAVERLQREKLAPLIPSVLLGVSYAGFGGSPGDRIDQFQDRFDFDAGVYWEIRNLGFGEHASREAADARLSQARLEEVRRMDQVAREVVETRVQARSAAMRIDVAGQGVRVAEDALARDLERIRNAQGLPIEVLDAVRSLDQARREYLRSIAEFNRAQFRLLRALGWPTG